ncbi:MAG TPA: RNA polymerase sigma factor [Steroidobacteraceae bacterium]
MRRRRRGTRDRGAHPDAAGRRHDRSPPGGAARLSRGDPAGRARADVDAVYRAESRRVLATLIRLLGDFDRAEEAVAEAFTAALEQWPRDGVPANPRAWLVSAGRFKAIDAMRRQARFDSSYDTIADHIEHESADPARQADDSVEDDRLRLVFTCCHPALAPDAQVAMTLREVCGLTTEEIASAFLVPAPTLAQRIVRAKAKIRDARIPYEVPAQSELPERLDAVLQVVYLVFNEGYSASTGDSLTRADLSAEAIRLGRLLVELLPEPEATGLLALMLLQDSRRAARTSAAGDIILLDEQDRSLWNRGQIAEGLALARRALGSRRFGPYTLQAAIAAAHAEAANAGATDWGRIVGIYDLLLEVEPSPVVELNRAAAIAMRDGPAAGLALVDAILARGQLGEYQPAHAARADLYRRLGRTGEARESYRRALELTRQEPARRFLERRLAGLPVS